MSAIYNIKNPWRAELLKEQASFRGIVFHVETGTRISGRRVVPHEYPKRNDNFAEDMGRSAIKINFTAYLIYRPAPRGPTNPNSPYYDYVRSRRLLREALEADDAGWLVHPVFCPGGMLVMCTGYSMVETRQRGGYTEFEMQFLDAGKPGNSITVTNTQADVTNKAAAVDEATKAALADVIFAQSQMSWTNAPSTTFGITWGNNVPAN